MAGILRHLQDRSIDDFLIGRVYLGEFPHGAGSFTFAMTRAHGFDRITADEHRMLYADGAVPTAEELHGVWRMDVISNNNQLGAAAHLAFDKKPDGRLESRYQNFGLFEGMVMPSFTRTHFQLNDFTPFRDEIRRIDADLMVGKWVAPMPPGMGPLLNQSVGAVSSRSGRPVWLVLPADANRGHADACEFTAPAIPRCAVTGRARDEVRRGDGGLVRGRCARRPLRLVPRKQWTAVSM